MRVPGPGWRPWIFVGVAVALACASAILTRLWLPGALASGVGAGLSVLVGVWTARGASALQARDNPQILPGESFVRHGRLPLIRDLTDPVALGVHPAATLETARPGRFTHFVRRDISLTLREVLIRDRFLLLVGESTAGKSRAAYELIRAELPHHRLVQADSRDTAEPAAIRAAARARTVLWLDDLERFLGTGGLTAAAVNDVLDAKGADRYLVATMRSQEYAKFSSRGTDEAGDIGRDALRQGWDVLRLATRVDVPRRWSPEEIARVSEVPGDPRLAEAVLHSSEFGVAEYLAAGPQLLAAWRDGWAPGTHPRAAAMILAAVDARRAGVHGPPPVETLLELHEPYLLRQGGDRLRPEDVDSALAWATTPLYATSSLLMPATGGLIAFDYLIDAIEKERIPADALDALIRIATPAESVDIGQISANWSLVDQADAAFRRAETGGLFEGTRRRCYLVAEDRGSAAGLRFAQDAMNWMDAVHGPDHPQTLEAKSLLAWQTLLGGNAPTAQSIFQELVQRSLRLSEADYEQVFGWRMAEAAAVAHSGDKEAGAKLYEQIAVDCRRVLGDDHEFSINCRDQAAIWYSGAGKANLAVRMLRDLLVDMSGRFRSSDEDVLHARSQLACCLAESGDNESAIREWRDIEAQSTALYGRLHSATTYARYNYAWCVGESGDPQRAVSLLQSLVSDLSEFNNPRLTDCLFARRYLAWWM